MLHDSLGETEQALPTVSTRLGSSEDWQIGLHVRLDSEVSNLKLLDGRFKGSVTRAQFVTNIGTNIG